MSGSRQATLRRLFDAIEREASLPELMEFLDDDSRQIGHPTNLFATGSVRVGPEIAEAWVRGGSSLLKQTYTVTDAIEAGDRLAVRYEWTSTLGRSILDRPPGSRHGLIGSLFCTFRGDRLLIMEHQDHYLPAEQATSSIFDSPTEA